ncbi:isocitrate lyase/phosphoenolpyruvate mutase family protein [Microbispora sp. NEAU-D428]|uniref:isocitrate lyase/PEP mutase family protein n=1 Tax=Microbispora sitophila TaxID=2771537 RepID=UPI0018696A3C|nr:isocitrate lyase/phosphoenolpyruvate mutase family protein [Microbispora sitophila]MBE3012727.1 isocitrate lyase/phosphoenolpyruvate mutase family protein [Microbispora sitophila]
MSTHAEKFRTPHGADFRALHRADFRALHYAQNPLVLPNAWDHASAAVLAAAGFAAIGTTSLGVAAAAGKPDATGDTAAETLALARRLAGLPCPVSVDIEGGFADTPEGVAEIAAELAALGVAGINIEDGRPDGTLADLAEQCETIAAVKSKAPGLFVNARTDTYWLGAGDLGTTIARLRAFAEAGADGVFVPGVAADDDVRTLVDAVDLPLNVLFLPGRHTVAGLAALGVRRISTGSLLLRAALHAVAETARTVAAGGQIPAGLPSYGDVQALAVR